MKGGSECPTGSDFDGYLDGTLPAARREAVRIHIEACVPCSLLLTRLSQAEEFGEAGTGEPDWNLMHSDFKGRLRHLESPVAGGRRSHWVTISGYVLVLALAIPSWLWLRSELEPPAQKSLTGRTEAKIVDLNVSRGPEAFTRASWTGNTMAALVFSIPEMEHEIRGAWVEDSKGRRVKELGPVKSWDGLGSYCLILHPAEFPGGAYRLLLDSGSGGSPRSLEFFRQENE